MWKSTVSIEPIGLIDKPRIHVEADGGGHPPNSLHGVVYPQSYCMYNLDTQHDTLLRLRDNELCVISGKRKLAINSINFSVAWASPVLLRLLNPEYSGHDGHGSRGPGDQTGPSQNHPLYWILSGNKRPPVIPSPRIDGNKYSKANSTDAST